MKYFLIGFCFLAVVAWVSCDCDVAKVSQCLDTFIQSSSVSQTNKSAICIHGNNFLNCISKASRGCNKDINKEINMAREQIRKMDCPITGAGYSLHQHAVIVPAVTLAVIALKKYIV